MDYPVNNHYTKITAKSRRRHERSLRPVGAVARGGEGVAPLLGDQLVHREVEERELREASGSTRARLQS